MEERVKVGSLRSKSNTAQHGEEFHQPGDCITDETRPYSFFQTGPSLQPLASSLVGPIGARDVEVPIAVLA